MTFSLPALDCQQEMAQLQEKDLGRFITIYAQPSQHDNEREERSQDSAYRYKTPLPLEQFLPTQYHISYELKSGICLSIQRPTSRWSQLPKLQERYLHPSNGMRSPVTALSLLLASVDPGSVLVLMISKQGTLHKFANARMQAL